MNLLHVSRATYLHLCSFLSPRLSTFSSSSFPYYFPFLSLVDFARNKESRVWILEIDRERIRERARALRLSEKSLFFTLIKSPLVEPPSRIFRVVRQRLSPTLLSNNLKFLSLPRTPMRLPWLGFRDLMIQSYSTHNTPAILFISLFALPPLFFRDFKYSILQFAKYMDIYKY